MADPIKLAAAINEKLDLVSTDDECSDDDEGIQCGDVFFSAIELTYLQEQQSLCGIDQYFPLSLVQKIYGGYPICGPSPEIVESKIEELWAVLNKNTWIGDSDDETTALGIVQELSSMKCPRVHEALIAVWKSTSNANSERLSSKIDPAVVIALSEYSDDQTEQMIMDSLRHPYRGSNVVNSANPNPEGIRALNNVHPAEYGDFLMNIIERGGKNAAAAQALVKSIVKNQNPAVWYNIALRQRLSH